MSVYYNEIDPFCAQWLRNLIQGKLLPKGDVDERDIRDVTPSDVRGYKQCHFFAGIGGWPYALKLARFNGPVWTGSVPCQPYSKAGQCKGDEDSRALWSVFFRLIRECRPATIFGEQVSSPLGRVWLASVQSDLEMVGYSFAAADLCAAGVGAPHLRQRLYFVGELGDPLRKGLSSREFKILQTKGRREKRPAAQQSGRAFWTRCEWIDCKDGKKRPIEPGSFPLADGIPTRVGRLRAYGNAIVPQVAKEFVESYLWTYQ